MREMPSYTPDFKKPVLLPDGRQLHAAYYRELPTCIAQGYTPSEALDALREMYQMVYDQMLASGQPMPEPLPPPTMRPMTGAPLAAGTVTGGAGNMVVGAKAYPPTGVVTTISGIMPKDSPDISFSFA